MKTWQFTASTAGKLGITEQALVVKSVILSKEYGKSGSLEQTYSENLAI
jgi:hypothetical protein